MNGGNNANQGEVPGMLGLVHAAANYGGAVLISAGGPGVPARALTAAHCLKYDLNDVTVHGGSLLWKEPGYTFKVKEYFINPGYVPPTGIDLAVLILDRPLPGTPVAQLADLDLNPYVVGTNVKMAGWGPLNINGVNPDHLQVLTLPLAAPSDCAREDRGSNDKCACCFQANLTGSTAGDSGGPVFKAGRLFGIIEGGKGGNSVATRVDMQRVWIDNPPEVHSFVVDSGPEAVAVLSNNNYKYVTHDRLGKVSVRNAAWGAVGDIPVGPNPKSIVASPDGSRLYVAHYSNISVINSTTNTVVGTSQQFKGGLSALAIAPDGRRLFVFHGSSMTALTIVDDTTMKAAEPVDLDFSPSATALAPDGSRIYATSSYSGEIKVVDPSRSAVVATWDTDVFGNSSVVATADRVYVGGTGNEVNVLDNNGVLKHTVKVAENHAVKSLAVSGAELYVGYETTNSSNLAQVGVQVVGARPPYTLGRTLQLGGPPLAALTSTPTGGILAVNGLVSSVSVIRP